jgi:hypothetical protein
MRIGFLMRRKYWGYQTIDNEMFAVIANDVATAGAPKRAPVPMPWAFRCPGTIFGCGYHFGPGYHFGFRHFLDIGLGARLGAPAVAFVDVVDRTI